VPPGGAGKGGGLRLNGVNIYHISFPRLDLSEKIFHGLIGFRIYSGKFSGKEERGGPHKGEILLGDTKEVYLGGLPEFRALLEKYGGVGKRV